VLIPQVIQRNPYFAEMISRYGSETDVINFCKGECGRES
jgi:hypothetical protein